MLRLTCVCFILLGARLASGQCNSTLVPFAGQCSGQGSCESINGTTAFECRCDVNFGGLTLGFDMQLEDCPIHQPAFYALNIIAFLLCTVAAAICIYRLNTYRLWDPQIRERLKIAALLILFMLIPLLIFAVFYALYAFAEIYLHNHVASLVLWCIGWLFLGADVFTRIYLQFFVASKISIAKARLPKKAIIMLLLPISLLSLGEVVCGLGIYLSEDTAQKIGTGFITIKGNTDPGAEFVRGIGIALAVGLVVSASAALVFNRMAYQTLAEHRATSAAHQLANQRSLDQGLQKTALARVVIVLGSAVPLAMCVLVAAMPVLSAYLLPALFALLAVSSLPGTLYILTPAKSQIRGSDPDSRQSSTHRTRDGGLDTAHSQT